MNLIKTFVLLCFISMLSACATPVTMSPQADKEEIKREKEIQRTMALKESVKMSERLFNVAYPILSNSQELCEKNTKYDLGLTLWNTDDLEDGFKLIARKLYDIDNYVSVMFVHKKSPAARADIRKGDRIVSINGEAIDKGEGALKKASKLLKNLKGEKVNLVIERDKKNIDKIISPTKICNFDVLLNYSQNELNAYATGNQIVIYKGMMKFTENDDELALIIGHEMAHNAMGHIDKKRQNQFLGHIGGLALDALLGSAGVSTGGEFGKFGAQIGANSYSVEFEKEADYVGMYFMERAGYNSKDVANVWRRMAIENPAAINKAYTHPTNPDRFLAIEKTYKEIANKKAKGLKLIPKLKEEDKG